MKAWPWIATGVVVTVAGLAIWPITVFALFIGVGLIATGLVRRSRDIPNP